MKDAFQPLDTATAAAESSLASRPPEHIKLRILLPLIAAIGILLAAFGLGIHEEQRRANERSSVRAVQSVQRLLRDDQKQYIDTMAMTIAELLKDERLTQALRERNRTALLERSLPLFENLKRVHRITHFYFHTPDRVNLLRVHNPQRQGDLINGLVLAAERTGQQVSGLEQGRRGVFVLRVVSPWRRDGQLLGYVELGVDFEDVIRAIHRELDVDLFVAVNKAVLNRKEWQRALPTPSQQEPWETFPSVVVMNRTLSTIPEAVQTCLRRDAARFGTTGEVIQTKAGVAQISAVPLHDAEGNTPAQLVVLRDITQATAETRESILFLGLICLAVGAGLIVFFYSFLGRIEGKLAASTAELRAEIAERHAAQQALREANERLEERVEHRTRQLQQANAELRTQISRREATQKELLAAQQQLVETSRHAGMAEVATSVLHNVGNVLNSVNISQSLLWERVRKSKIANLGKATALMQEHAGDLPAFFGKDPKGQRLPGYLNELAAHLTREQQDILQELKLLGHNIEHIKEIVAMQQSYATVSGLIESLPITDLVEDALRVHAAALERHHIQVQRDYAPVPRVAVDKHKVLQILVNLISNARHACLESVQPDKRLTVQVRNGDGRVCITVSDNGVGIAPENLTRVFQFGFTTRKTGHGFGLHSGALAANELGGTLRLQSDGLGKGATAILELPCSFTENPLKTE